MPERVRIFVPINGLKYELCLPINEVDIFAIAELIDGHPRASSWVPIPMQVIRFDEGHRLVRSDAPWLLSSAIVLRPNAVAALHELLQAHGELLPLDCPDAELVVFNARALPALDTDNSAVDHFRDGRIMSVYRHAFHQDAVAGVDAFRLQELKPSFTYLSERFVERWHSAGLEGLDFHLVWDSARPAREQPLFGFP